MHDQATGGNDLLIGGLGAGTNFLHGDAASMTGSSHGGNDTVIGGDSSSMNVMYGDAFTMADNTVGGNDLLVAGNNSINYMYGDARTMSGNAVAGNDTLVSGSGTDFMWGDAYAIIGSGVVTGQDTFVFLQGNGTDSIFDFRQSDGDKIQLSDYHFSGMADLQISAVGSDTLIQFGSTGNSVTLVGFSDPSLLNPSDFIF